jgi:plastocyanin
LDCQGNPRHGLTNMNYKYKFAACAGLLILLAAGCSKSSTPASSSGQQQTPAQGQQNTVTYTDSGFSPKTLNVKKGDWVVFLNQASDAVRVASNPHPIHNGYPTTGGCVSSTFDSCSNIAPGQSWSFKFDLIGTWGYHNHLNPSEGGTIVVQ